MTNVSFKISSGLKDIIGRDLITDDFIAVFELVKNSFDANAREVEIVFQGLTSAEPCIIIKDNGDGMNEDDLRNKWLFVAYSAKKQKQDYRDKIKPTRVYAGAKGIGRFSCDRLGAKLKLITRKKTEKGPYHVIDVDWSKFETDPESEFHTIPATLTKTDTRPFPGFQSGTILEISALRSDDWTRKKLLNLRRSLERLINPNQGNDAENFSIILRVPDEELEDKVVKQTNPDEPWRIVNEPIKNFIFETLELKTTQIKLEIDPNGEFLITRLRDRGTLIYELTEHNPYANSLYNIHIVLFFLNRSAKATFARQMGVRTFEYGSVFLYKNGFRIHPIGDDGDDSLGVVSRKQQGFFRYLGHRDLSGRIEIDGDNPGFRETSSRDGGLIESQEFDDLRDFFTNYALKRLENYVINLKKFGEGGLDDAPELDDPKSSELREFAFDIIVKLTQSDNVIDINYNSNVLDILENISEKSVTGLLKNLRRISAEQNNTRLHKEISRTERRVKALTKAKEEAERETEKERERAKQAEQESKEAYAKAQKAEDAARKAEEEAQQSKREAQQSKEEAQQSKEEATQLTTQNLFLKSVLSKDLEHVLELHHSIKQDARSIDEFSSYLLGMIKNKHKPLKPEKIQAILERISFTARKITTISRFATQANFRADAEKITADLTAYIREYLLNIYGGFVLDPYQHKIDIQFSPPSGAEFATQFTPINVSIVLDNLISNSRKHKTKTITVSVLEQNGDSLIISFKDDGKGILRKNISSLFEIGFTTTDGSGLGLYHSRSAMLEMNGNIDINEHYKDGAEFILTFSKQ